MISAFGARAERFACALDVPSAIVFEPDRIVDAYREAVRRRAAAAPFGALFVHADPRVYLTRNALPAIVRAHASFDERRALLESIALGDQPVNNRPARESWAWPSPFIAQVADVFTLADGVLVRSFAELERLQPFLIAQGPIDRVLAEPVLPPALVPARAEPSVAVWAPTEPADALLFEAFALTEFLGPVAIVCAHDAVDAFAHVTWLHPDEGRAIERVASAAVVVAPDHADPGTAVALARRGFHVVAPRQSGAHEFVPGIVTYDGASQISLIAALAAAAGRAATAPIAVGSSRPYPSPHIPIAVDDLPLVSVVVPTFNRRADLADVLTCLRDQRYPRVEAVVVNDAGEPIDDIVAAFPFARLIDLERNGGVTRAVLAGFSAARGVYVQTLADDDWLFPDHVQRLVAALVRTGAPAAHSNTLIRFQERGDDGRWHTVGFNAGTFRSTASPTDALLSTAIAGHAVLVKKTVFDAIGPWRADTFLSDQEFQFRLWSRYSPVWVDAVTVEWRFRGGANFSTSVDSASELERLFFEVHPVVDRPLVQKMRRTVVANTRNREPGMVFPPTVTFAPE